MACVAEAELDVGAEGLAAAAPSPRASPPRAPAAPFGDLGCSRVLGMVEGRANSMPKDHKEDHAGPAAAADPPVNNGLPSSTSLSGLTTPPPPSLVSNLELSMPRPTNGSHDFLDAERHLQDENASIATLVPHTPVLAKASIDELKANINRIDSHHGNLEALGRLHEL